MILRRRNRQSPVSVDLRREVRGECLAAAVIVITLALGSRVRAENPSADPVDEAERAEAFLDFASTTAASYDVAAGAPEAALDLVPDPVLTWTNPEVGQLNGGLFLWTSAGRPAAVAAIYKWFAPSTHSTMELHSLWLQPVSLHSAGKDVWTPASAGIEYNEVPQAAPPGASAAQRLRQMRQLARGFSADSTDREGQRRELRLLTQPLFRYDVAGADVLDGAVFAYVRGTDPEILLLIEARRTESGFTWQRAAARLNSIQLRLLQDDEVVWEAAELPWSTVFDRTRPYFAMRAAE